MWQQLLLLYMRQPSGTIMTTPKRPVANRLAKQKLQPDIELRPEGAFRAGAVLANRPFMAR
jgi:hypothetical protein